MIFRPRGLLLSILSLLAFVQAQSASALPNRDIVFVTQVPNPLDFGNPFAALGNQTASMQEVPRGGDLYIRYADGTLKNLTQAAGYGMSGMQGANAIAVRDPSVSWDGTKVIFSMVRGAPTQRYQVLTFYWQLYEMTGLGKFETPVISKVPNQPDNYNNTMPIYGTDDRIIFVSDRPRGGERYIYPQRDEYESFHTNTGIWSLNPSTGDLFLLDHAPSGDFTPTIDSFGRVIFTRWDHLQRDQQAKLNYGTFNYASEAEDAQRINSDYEVFPEPRSSADDNVDPKVNFHSFNQFFPWQINEDGTDEETLNHIGRHELHGYFDRSFNDDPDISEFSPQSNQVNQNRINNMFQIREDPLNPGMYYGIDSPEFGTHASGQIIKLSGAPNLDADHMAVTYVTHRDTSSADDTPSVNHSGLYRNPLPLSDGSLLAVHTSETRQDQNEGTTANPISRYQYRIKTIAPSGGTAIPVEIVTSGISKSVSWWDPDTLVSFNGNLWELQPVELRARPRPPRKVQVLESQEQSVIQSQNVSLEELKAYLVENNLAVVVSRNLTTRDKNDEQQPFNLKVKDSYTETVGNNGKKYEIAHLQFFQGDLIRGYGGVDSPSAGRRVLAQPMHDADFFNPADPGGPQGSVAIGSDGSMAAFVPARRALSWQMTDGAGKPVVRERYWLTFQPGEIRLCKSCHGINTHDQAGNVAPENEPEALRNLVAYWKQLPMPTRPSFSLSIKSTNPSGKKSSSLFSGRKYQLNVKGAASKSLKLKTSINGKSCTGDSALFSTDSSGRISRKAKAPNVRGRVKVKFLLTYLGTEADKISTKLQRSTRDVQVKKLRASELKKLCRRFKFS